MIVLDTPVLLFWTLDPDRLSNLARNTIETADKIVVSSISIWELAMKIKRQKLVIPLSIVEHVDRLEQLANLEIRFVDMKTWQANIELSWDHRDPADRTIVALAIQNGCPLVTSDQTISDFYSQTIW